MFYPANIQTDRNSADVYRISVQKDFGAWIGVQKSYAHRSEHMQHAAVSPSKNGLFVQIQIINKILSEIF